MHPVLRVARENEMTRCYLTVKGGGEKKKKTKEREGLDVRTTCRNVQTRQIVGRHRRFRPAPSYLCYSHTSVQLSTVWYRVDWRNE